MSRLFDRIGRRKIANPDGTADQSFDRLMSKAFTELEEQITTLATTVATLETTVSNLRRIGSHTEPTSIFSATDAGVLTIAAHTRVYADGTTLAVAGSTVTGLLNNTWYGVYYDDTTLASATPTYVVTTSIDDTPAAKASGRHFCGLILTPKAASGVVVESGGTYSTGSGTVGGEVSGHEVVP